MSENPQLGGWMKNKSDQVHIYHSKYISISLVLFNIHKEFVLLSSYLLCTIA